MILHFAIVTWKMAALGLLILGVVVVGIFGLNQLKNLFWQRRTPMTEEESRAYHAVDGQVDQEKEQAEAEEQKAQAQWRKDKNEFFRQLAEQETLEMKQVQQTSEEGSQADKQKLADKVLADLNKPSLLWVPFLALGLAQLFSYAPVLADTPSSENKHRVVAVVPPGYTLLKTTTYKDLLQAAVRLKYAKKRCQIRIKDAHKYEKNVCRRQRKQCKAELKGCRKKKQIWQEASFKRKCPNVAPWQAATIVEGVVILALGVGLAFSVRQNFAKSTQTLYVERGP